MTDEEIRSIVREAIGRHLGHAAPAPASAPSAASLPAPPWRSHASFGRFLLAPTAAQEGMCLIEPAVACNHCGYCESLGH